VPSPASSAPEELIIGTYTERLPHVDGKAEGILSCRYEAGTIGPVRVLARTRNPSFLVVSPDGRRLYAVNETVEFEGQPGGGVTAFVRDTRSGDLSLLNTRPSGGVEPAHLELDPSGHFLLVANYRSGSVAVFGLEADGSIGPMTDHVQHEGSSVHPVRQSGPHAHSANLSPDGKFVLYADLGLDQILAYRLDPTKGMDTANPVINKVAPGSGPRHFAFGPKGKFAYVCNEIADTVTVFSYEPASGTLKELQTVSMVPKDYTGAKSAAEIFVHPNGKFLYASNRGHDSIVVFAIDGRKGTLTPVDWTPTQGKTPRNFAIDPTGGYLFAANQDAGGVVLFKIDKKTGKLTATGDKMNVPFPVCVVFR